MKKTIATLVLLTAPVLADRIEGQFNKLDVNKDGKVAKDEFFGSESLFDRWDADKDGFLTLDEMRAGRKAPRKTTEVVPERKPEKEQKGGKSPKQHGDALFQKLDANGDGKITKDELPERGAQKLSRLDRNKDGIIDRKEFDAMSRRRGGGGGDWGKRLKAMDANKDGSVSKDEWKGRPEHFARLDSDKDGVISSSEIDAFSKRARQQGGWKNRPGDALFRRLDTNGDKKISKEEWKLNADLFAKFDANGDGFVTADEVTPKTRGDEMPAGRGADAMFRKLDKNKDGKIDATEMPDERRLATLGRDGDGFVSRAEMEQAMDQARSEKSLGFIARFDADRDGKVTRDEFKGPAKLFDRIDKNGDGVVDATEAEAAGKKMRRGKGK